MRGCTFREIVLVVLLAIVIVFFGFASGFIQRGLGWTPPSYTTNFTATGANPSGGSTDVVPPAPTAAPPVASQAPSGGYCGLGIWGSSGVSSGDTIQGIAVINGAYNVNGDNFTTGGTNKIGYIAVLEDAGTYTINSSGTACKPITGTPSQSDIQTVINALVQDQRSNGCSGGCSTSRIQKFSGGSPDGTSYTQ